MLLLFIIILLIIKMPLIVLPMKNVVLRTNKYKNLNIELTFGLINKIFLNEIVNSIGTGEDDLSSID